MDLGKEDGEERNGPEEDSGEEVGYGDFGRRRTAGAWGIGEEKEGEGEDEELGRENVWW